MSGGGGGGGGGGAGEGEGEGGGGEPDGEDAADFVLCPIFAAASSEQQEAVFQPTPPNVRKIILATNIAETSVTISGVKYVVDAGLSKVRSFAAATGVDMLKTVTISKGQADQRKGRAGREQAGRCWRLYTEPAFETMKDAATPEIQRVDLAEVVLQLKVAGVTDVSAFEFVAPPSTAALKHALETLTALGAIAKTGGLTDHGRRMALLPLAPVWAHTLLQAPKFGCVAEILTAAAMLSVDHIWIVPVRDE